MGFGWFDCCRPCIGSGQGLVLPAPPSLGDHHSLKPSLCPRFDHARSIGGQVCNLAQPFLIGTLGCVRMWSERGKDETSCTLSSLSQTGGCTKGCTKCRFYRRLVPQQARASRKTAKSLESLRSSFSPDARARPLARTTSDDMARGSLTTNWRIGGRSWKAPGTRRLVAHASRSTDRWSGMPRSGIGPPSTNSGHPPRANSTPSTMNAVLRLLKVG